MELAAKIATSTLYSTPTPVADVGKGQQLSEETLKLAGTLGDRASEAKILWNLQLLNLLQNKAVEAIDYGEKSLSIARELNLREQMAYVLSDLGWAYNVACQFEKVNERLEEGALIWRELGNMPMLSNNLTLSIFQFFWTGKNEDVLRITKESYQLSSSIKETWNQSLARNFQSMVWFEYGEIDQALAALEESIRLIQTNAVYQGWYNAQLCRMYADLGAAHLGMDVYRANRTANEDVLIAPTRSGTLISYALFELANNQPDTAASTLDACTPDAPPWESMLRLARCRLALARADLSAAMTFADLAVEITHQYKLGRYLAEALFLKGKVHFMRGDLQEAKITLEQARVEAEKLGSRQQLWQIITQLSVVETDKTLAEALKKEAQEIVQYIADRITRQDLREAFLRFAAVNAVLV
jgi:tetratricopeptide (TPR) repeat protein